MNEAGAAVVAAQILAFYKEPVRYRSRLTHGREHFRGGLLVFRFAHGKFSHALMRDLTTAERERLRLAAAFFIRQVCLWEGATHHQVLCVPADARRETIKEHYQGLIALLHPDRQETASEDWPAGAAQRVNRAYAVLSDEVQRRQYDAGLHSAEVSTPDDEFMAAPLTASARSPIVGKFAAARIRMRKPVLVFGAVLASLFFVQTWWFGDLPREYTTLASAAPFDLSSQWMRDVQPASERPRFMSGAEPQRGSAARAQDATAEAPIPFLTPLWRALSTRASETRSTPREPVEPRVAKLDPPVLPNERQAPLPRTDAPAQRIDPPAAPVEKAAARAEAPQVRNDAPMARAEAPAPRREPVVVAQAVTPRVSPPPAAESALSATDMEMLVARIVTYYEGGDLDRLVALYDVGSIGFWEAVRIRHDFEDFFRATRTRRLRLNRVSWETAAQSARARGEAALSAEYFEQPAAKLERNVELELDVIVRDGQPRIARLLLFPHSR